MEVSPNSQVFDHLRGIDVTRYHDLFARDGYVVVPNFLPENLVQTARAYSESRATHWHLTTYPAVDRVSIVPATAETWGLRTSMWNEAASKVNNPDFLGYRFYRTIEATPELSDLFNHSAVTAFVNQVTEAEVSTLHASFLTKYTSGCFLSVHSDEGNGKVAFSIRLTENWHAMKGGSVTILDRDNGSAKAIGNLSNSLTLLRIGNHGPIRYISHVPNDVQGFVTSFAGWFN